MDKQAEEALLTSGFKRVDMPLAIGSYETIEATDTGVPLDPDLMHIKFILCHEGVNANGDFFTKEVLQKAQLTPRNKPVDWEHGQPIIGTMLDSTYKEDGSGRGYIEAVGVVWKFLYPELSSGIKSKAATGELKLSMECYYKEANYKVGDQLFDQQSAEKMGLIPFVGREYMGKKVARVFNEVIFGGVGVVANPADKEAVFLSVAKDLSSHGIATGVESQIELSMVSEAIANAITRTVNDFREKTPETKDIQAVTIARYVKAFDKAKSLIVAKFNTEQNQTKEQVVAEVRSALNTFLQEVSAISQEYYKGVAGEEVDRALAEDLFFSDIQRAIGDKLYRYFAELSDNSIEAYLEDVAEEYFIYKIYDYSKEYPNSGKLLKGFYSVVDGEVHIDLGDFIEMEQVYKEKSKATEIENSVEEVIELSKENEEIVDTAQAEEVVVDYQAIATDLQGKVDSLTEQLSVATQTSEGLQARVAELEQELGKIESAKIAEARVAELTGLGIVISEARQAKLVGMSDTEYADLKDLLVEAVASAKTVVPEVTVEEEPVLEAEASVEDEEDEIVVEGIKISAGLNIESPQHKAIRPFGHLASK